MASKIELLSMTPEEVLDFVLNELGESKFRAKQIGEWLVRGADIDGMTNLSAKLREKLSEIAVANPVSILQSFKSKIDETEKFLFSAITKIPRRSHISKNSSVTAWWAQRYAFAPDSLIFLIRNSESAAGTAAPTPAWSW